MILFSLLLLSVAFANEQFGGTGVSFYDVAKGAYVVDLLSNSQFP